MAMISTYMYSGVAKIWHPLWNSIMGFPHDSLHGHYIHEHALEILQLRKDTCPSP